MANKTVQALKITASWTPNESAAASMMKALKAADLEGARIGGGRLAIKHAIATDYADPAHANRVSKRLFAIKQALGATGTLHSFNVVAGAVPADEAEVLPDPEPEPEAE